MLLRPTHFRVIIMPDTVTGRDSISLYSAMMDESRIDAPASSRPVLYEQNSPITVPKVPDKSTRLQ
jgi:hypothetical protein